MLSSSSQSPYGVLRRPLFRTILFVLIILLLFIALPHSDPYHFLENLPPAPPPPPPLDTSPPTPPKPEWPSRYRIKPQRPLAEPAHDGPWAERADAVRGAFLHAYEGYLTYAAPHDELRPLSKRPVDKYVSPLPRARQPLPLVDTAPFPASTVGAFLSSIPSTRCGSWACTRNSIARSPSWLTRPSPRRRYVYSVPSV